jgi:hypothetical protein
MFGEFKSVSSGAHVGHLSDGSGLQKHSCGSLYPWTVRAVGRGDDVLYQAFNAVTGELGAMFSTDVLGWDVAHQKAESECEVAACWRR